ncbi:MAG: hypothetical protein WC147_07650 [Syntrophomonas sp.]
MKIDWAKKLSSRKFWALLTGLATSGLILAKVPENMIVQVAAVIGAFGSVIGYILAEAYVDGQAVEKE